MPLTLQIVEDEFQLGIWCIEEPESYFLDQFSYSKDELQEIDNKLEQHRLQLLASRAVLQYLKISDSGYKFLKDNYGKPHIINVQGDISFTHSHNQAAAIYSKTKLVGIDIQLATEKITRIASKFISPDEMSFIEHNSHLLDHQHVIWGAKESLYKAYGQRKVDFKENLKIFPFKYHPNGNCIKGKVEMPDYTGEFDISYQKINNYYLVYCIESKKE